MYFKCALCLQQRKIHYKMSEVLLFGNLAFICSLIKKKCQDQREVSVVKRACCSFRGPQNSWGSWQLPGTPALENLASSPGFQRTQKAYAQSYKHSYKNKLNKNISLRGFSYFETITEGKAHLFLCVLVGFFPNKFTEYLFIESNYMYFQ